MPLNPLDSDFLNYIVEHDIQPGGQLPALTELSQELDINVGKLREQLEVARSLGLVEVKTRTGIRVKDYDFLPAIRKSLMYALARDRAYLETFTELRNHVEAAFLGEAAAQLTADDKRDLRTLVEVAFDKLNRARFIEIPHAEHRQFHLKIFQHLDNPFVMGILEAYWEAYEAVELNAYAELNYWQEAWKYHDRILNFICNGDYEAARLAFIEHTQLLRHRNEAIPQSSDPGPTTPRGSRFVTNPSNYKGE